MARHLQRDFHCGRDRVRGPGEPDGFVGPAGLDDSMGIPLFPDRIDEGVKLAVLESEPDVVTRQPGLAFRHWIEAALQHVNLFLLQERAKMGRPVGLHRHHSMVGLSDENSWASL